MRVRRSASWWKVTTPLCWSPCVTRHSIRSSGRCSTISASNSFEIPQILALNETFVLVLLRDPLEAVHELRPFLELGPLVVGDADRHGDIDRLLDRHPPALAHAGRLVLLPAVVAAVVAAPGHQALAGLLGQPTGAAGLLDLLADGVRDATAEFVAGLLDGIFSAADALGQLRGALYRQRRQRSDPGAGRDALHAERGPLRPLRAFDATVCAASRATRPTAVPIASPRSLAITASNSVLRMRSGYPLSHVTTHTQRKSQRAPR